MTEKEMVELVLTQFTAAPVRNIQNAPVGECALFVGRVAPAGETAFLGPADSKPCCWYNLEIHEDRKMPIANRRHGPRTMPVKMYEESKSCDFYLVDGDVRVLVQGSKTETIKVAGTDSIQKKCMTPGASTQPIGAI